VPVLRSLLRWFLRFGPIRRWHYRPALRLHSRARARVAADSGTAPIAVADIMARFTPAEHLARADAYFVREEEEASLFRRPFQRPADTQPRLAGLSTVLQLLDLPDGAHVLDFGCGTGWLARCLATMGADVVATDVSSNVLELGRRFLARDPLAAELRVEFRRFDGARLPTGDASMDRVVSFDAFHHVLDQAATLAEMARVLRPGGIAVFHEPGPQHSGTPDAQYEMGQFAVIENDIDVHAIWRIAQGCGFTDIRMALPALQSPIVRLSDFDRVAAGRPSMPDLRDAMQNIVDFSYNLRIFALYKGGSPA
jgi:SAM-dependent methyltransferase